MPSLIQGRIVYPKIAIPDPQGRNPKPKRPFVVITKTDDIKSGGTIQAVGITSELTESPQDHYVPLRYGRGCHTGLLQPSAALCSWLIDIAQDKVEFNTGYVDPKSLAAIVSKVNSLATISHKF